VRFAFSGKLFGCHLGTIPTIQRLEPQKTKSHRTAPKGSTFCDLVGSWKPIGWAIEPGQINSAIGPYLKQRMRERRTRVAVKLFASHHDKAVRAQSIRGRMELDGLYVPTQAHWYPAFLSELLNFPAGKHDDQVDALGLIGQVLDRMNKGTVPPNHDQKIRFMNEMTMDEAWSLARPKRPDLNARI
jgi:predicted phage terminase large subunit-like protein